MGELGILPGNLAERLLQLVGQRNLLVHEYIDIDRGRLYDSLRHELGDLEEFAKHIGKLL